MLLIKTDELWILKLVFDQITDPLGRGKKIVKLVKICRQKGKSD